MFVIPAVFYIFIGLAGCLMNPEISYDMRKLARTRRVKKKKLPLRDSDGKNHPPQINLSGHTK
jgi:hypothetical protein